MIILLLLLVSLYLHCWDDFHHQGCLKEMKQKKWWQEHPQYNDMYENDYKVCMMVHAFEWSFTVHAPYLIYGFYHNLFTDMKIVMSVASIAFHTLYHARIDSMKANEYTINLIEDQSHHMIQLLMIMFSYGVILNII